MTDRESGARIRGSVDRAGLTRRKVLVVDDDPDWRELVSLSLEELGYQAEQAATGEEALQALARGGCSVMLLDLRMPGLSGEDVLERLPDDGPRVVLLTSAGLEEVQQALGRRPHYYLSKSAGRDALALLLQSLEA